MASKKIAAVLIAGALSVSLAACGSDDDGGSGANPDVTPAAEVASLSNGVSTAVKLDATFVSTLTKLGVTPGVVGTAKLTDGSLIFPITGGNVKYYTPGTVNPFVQGIINHNGSGLSLTAGGIKVELENFDVDPGASVLTGKVSANGSEVAAKANLFFLDGRTLQPIKVEGKNAILQGTTVKIHPDAAKLLNDTYKLTGANAIPDYFTVGIATITAATAA